MNEVPAAIIQEEAARLGLTLTGLLSTAQVREALLPDIDALRRWQSAGAAGDMRFMERSPELFGDLEAFLPGVRSIAVFAISYWSEEHHPPVLPKGYGRVARYAWGRDYHRVLKRRLKHLVGMIEQRTKHSIAYRVFTDAVPLLERAIARTARLGFTGNNTMLITPGIGSFTFLAEVLWDVQPVAESEPSNPRGQCGACRRCLPACPTQAIVSEKFVDARRCISYLTIEKEGTLSEWEAEALGEWAFGCDICQDVCPFNHDNRPPGTVEELTSARGSGSLLNLIEVLGIRTDAEFLSRYQGTPLMRPGREGLLRNACCVLANTNAGEAREALHAALSLDPSAVVREHAERALTRLERAK
ncbi:MAG: tRNA epoxyqueuosine(34) reductase QueG [Bdellovibrionales bacterium]|nr:tRNA epoxyqueuosine(34) reductase QueG [Bdellovibrionales bacterium]